MHSCQTIRCKRSTNILNSNKVLYVKKKKKPAEWNEITKRVKLANFLALNEEIIFSFIFIKKKKKKKKIKSKQTNLI